MLLIFFIFIVSKIKNIGAAIDFCGAVFFTILCFIAPIILYEKNVSPQKKWKYSKLANYFVIIVGTFSGIASAYNSFSEIFI